MKKIFYLLLVLPLGLGTLNASAQEKGEMAAGINLGVAPCLESGASTTNFGIGAKFQYNISNPFRLEAALDYGFKNKGKDVMTVGVNAHYLFKIGNKFNVYPLVGLGYGHLGGSSVKFDEDAMGELGDLLGEIGGSSAKDEFEEGLNESRGSASANKFYFNVGAGAEYSISSHLSAALEIKYQYIKDFNRLPISLGVTYRF